MELKYKLSDQASNDRRIAEAGACGEGAIRRGKGIQWFCIMVAILAATLGVVVIFAPELKGAYGLDLILCAIGMYPLSGLGKLIEAQGFVLLSETRHEMERKSGHT